MCHIKDKLSTWIDTRELKVNKLFKKHTMKPDKMNHYCRAYVRVVVLTTWCVLGSLEFVLGTVKVWSYLLLSYTLYLAVVFGHYMLYVTVVSLKITSRNLVE